MLTQSGQLRLATLANFFFFASVTSFFTLPVHLEALGAGRAEIGRVMGSFGAVSLWAIPLTGALSDRYGRRPFLALGAVLWCAAALGFVMVRDLGPLVYALRMLQGLGFSLVFVSTNALIVDLAPEGQLGRSIAIFGTATLAAHAVGPSVAEYVILHAAFVGLFIAAAVVGVLALVLFWPVGETGSRRDPTEARYSTLQMLRRPAALGTLWAAFSAACAFGAAIHFMSVFVRARGLGVHTPFFVSYVALAIFVRLVMGGLGDRIGHHRVAVVATFAFGCAVLTLGFAASPLALVLAGALFGGAHGMSYPSLNALFVGGVPASARARAMAAFNLAFNVGVTFAAFGAGELAERYGYATMWFVFGAVALSGALVAALDRPREHVVTD
jgi:MFS family permease